MRHLTNEEVGYVYGAGTYGKPTAGNNKRNVEGRGMGKTKKAKKAKKVKVNKSGTAAG